VDRPADDHVEKTMKFLSLCSCVLFCALPSPVLAQIRLTEFCAENQTGLADEDGDTSDWIEVHNHSRTEQNLAGWSLTDDGIDPGKWSFPDVRLKADEYLVVFASGKDRRRPGRPLHTNFKLSKTGEYLSLTNSIGERIDAFDPRYPEQLTDISFGHPVGEARRIFRFLAFPTPGRKNVTMRSGKLSTVTLSEPHGLFQTPFSLEARAADRGVTIRHTLDGSRPNETSRVLEGPLEIKNTTVIRIRGYRTGHAPTPVVTRSYIFPADRLDDSADGLPPAGYPYRWGAGKAHYGMDSTIIGDPRHRKTILAALHALPSFSIVTEADNLFSNETGIYAHAGWHGRGAERAGSLELLPAGPNEPGFQAECGIRMRGGFSRRPSVPKHGFRFFFRHRYGTERLKYNLFGGKAARECTHFDLRCSQNYAWHHGFSSNALYIRDQLNRDLQFAMGHPSPRGNFRHVYVNGHYWGLYNTCERPKALFGEFYIGGKKEDFDVVKIQGGYSEGARRAYQVFPTDGNMDLWSRLDELSQRDLSGLEAYCQMIGVKTDGSPDLKSPRLLDPINLIDYMLVIFYGGNLDAPISWFGNNRGGNNWHGLINRKQSQGFRFIIWDSEHTLLDVEEDRLGPFPLGKTPDRSNPHWLYQRLLDNREFRVLLADRIARHLFRDGVLTPGRVLPLFDRRINEIKGGLFAEAARWGNPRKTFESVLSGSTAPPRPSDSGLAKYQAWFQEIERTRTKYIPNRTRIIINQFFGRGLYPDLPEIAARLVPATSNGSRLELKAGESKIYYTTNNQDPRRFGGELNKTARLYEGPLSITTGTLVLCRIRNDDGEWGPLREISPDRRLAAGRPARPGKQAGPGSR